MSTPRLVFKPNVHVATITNFELGFQHDHDGNYDPSIMVENFFKGKNFGPTLPAYESNLEDTDKEQVQKDKKAMNILFNGVDSDLFDNIINCKTAKDVWDIIQVIYDGTEQVRENKMHFLIQQYEHFHSEEDSNLKLLKSLPKEWKPMTVSLKYSQYYKEFTLERLYGILKTYEPEIEQDEKMEKGRKKGGSITLVAEQEKEKEIKVEAIESAPNSNVCERKGKGLVAEHEDQLSQDEMDDIDDHLAFLSRRFSKLKFKKNFGAGKPNRNMVDKSKFKCFKCGLAGHFASECRKSNSDKKKFEPVDYKQKYFELLKQKERAFITQENDWAAYGLEDDEDTSYVNLALMDKSDEIETSSSSNQCGSVNHLSVNCKLAMPTRISTPPSFPIMPTMHVNVMPTHNLNAQYANMPFAQNPYYAAFKRAGTSITFGDDKRGYTLGYGLISKDNIIIEEVALVDGLEHNLWSFSQLCDRGNLVTFNAEACVVTNKKSNKVVLTGVRKGNVYLADFNSTNAESVTCLLIKASQDESWLWHKKLSHLNFKTMNELVKKELVRGIPQVEFSKDGLCDTCQKGKQIKASFKKKLESSIKEPL
ncbi:hypothetical protein AgCh_017376 [Apium graveolens]